MGNAFFYLVMVAVCEPNRLGELDGCAPKLKFWKLLKEVASGGSSLPLDGKASADGGGGDSWNGLKLEGPNLGNESGAGPGPEGGNGSIYGGETETTGGRKLSLLLLLLLLLLSFGNRFAPFNLSNLFLISNSLHGWFGKFFIKSLSVPFFFTFSYISLNNEPTIGFSALNVEAQGYFASEEYFC